MVIFLLKYGSHNHAQKNTIDLLDGFLLKKSVKLILSKELSNRIEQVRMIKYNVQ